MGRCPDHEGIHTRRIHREQATTWSRKPSPALDFEGADMSKVSPSLPIAKRLHRRVRADKQPSLPHMLRMEARISFLEEQLSSARSWIKDLIKERKATA